MRAKITTKLLAAQKGPFEIWDALLSGLSARRQSASGRVVYRFRFTDITGRKKNVVLGDAAVLTVEQARREARVLAGAAENANRGDGVDPAQQRQRVRQAPTLATVWNDYNAHRLAKKRNRTPEAYRGLWRAHLGPRLGHMKLSKIDTKVVEDFHTQISKGESATRSPGGRIAANRAKSLLSGLFTFAIETGRWYGVNPCRTVRDNPEYERDLRFSDEELDLILTALSDEGEEVQIAFDLFLETPVRHSNIAAAEWSEFVDLGGEQPVWRIPSEKLKGGKPYQAPLSKALGARIAAFRDGRLALSGRYLFPLVVRRLRAKACGFGKAGRAEHEFIVDVERHRQSFRSAWRRVRARALKQAGAKSKLYTALQAGGPHTFKHTYLSRLADLGAAAHELKLAGDHADIRTSMLYVHRSQGRLRELADNLHARLRMSRS